MSQKQTLLCSIIFFFFSHSSIHLFNLYSFLALKLPLAFEKETVLNFYFLPGAHRQ